METAPPAEEVSTQLTAEDILRNRIPDEQRQTLNVFQNYSRGEPTTKLYIKNLAKQVTEKELEEVFGIFFDPTLLKALEIKLMKTGRMKGQAFVTFVPTADACEGEPLHDSACKELVLCSASSARHRMDPPSNKGRIPLTNVSNNVNQRACKSTAPYNDLPEEVLHQKNTSHIGTEESFFMYRKNQRKASFGDENPFNLLSDEVLLHVLKWLPKKTLLSCGQVNRRFNRVSKDETLWYRLDLSNRTLQFDGLVEVLSRGVIVLRLAQTSIANPTPNSCLELQPGIKVQYLDLSMCTISLAVLGALLSNCRALVKLSLENVPLDGRICEEIAENRRLETLNLTMCSGIDAMGMRLMAKALTRLHSLNVSWTNLSGEAVQELVRNITPQVMHLNIAGCRSTLSDEGVAVLIKRCPKLIALDLSDCTPLTEATIKTLCKARKIEYLSLSRCYNIPVTAYLNLTELKTLRYLDLFGLVSDHAIATLKHSLGDVGINRYYHSSVARPTVGTKRTSIWGLRTRD
uniref:S-phase kinase-associated protein 2 n=1 Tax=Anopheles epiroticus TaxID=199890 RepID=A0A182PJ26_9DIPT